MEGTGAQTQTTGRTHFGGVPFGATVLTRTLRFSSRETTQRENQGDQTGKGNTGTQTNTENTREHHSIAPRAALVHGGKGNKGPQKTPGHTSKAEEHKGAKGT